MTSVKSLEYFYAEFEENKFNQMYILHIFMLILRVEIIKNVGFKRTTAGLVGFPLYIDGDTDEKARAGPPVFKL